MIKLNGYFIAISVLVVLVSSETFDNRTTPQNGRIPTQPPNPLPQEGTTTTVRFLNQGTPGAPTTRPPPATTTQPVGRGPTPVRSTQVSPARQNQTPARATSSSSRPPTPTARSPSPARQGQTPAGPSTSRPPTPTASSSMRPTPTGTTSSRRPTPSPVNQNITSTTASTSRGTRTTPTVTSAGSRRTTPPSTLSSSGGPTDTLPPSTPTPIITPEFTTPSPSPVVSSGSSPDLSSGGVTTGGVTSSLASTPGVSTGGVITETAGVSTTTVGSSSMSSSSPSTSPVVSTSLSTESSSGSPSTTSPASSSSSTGSTTAESTSTSSVSPTVSTGSSSSASSSSASSSASTSESTSASTSPTSTASSTSTSVPSPSSSTSTTSSTTTSISSSTTSSTTPSTTPTSMSTTPSSTPPISTPPLNGGGQLIHTQIMFCNMYGSLSLEENPIWYIDYINHLKMAISSTCGVGPDRIQGLELVEDRTYGNALIQFDVLPGPGLSTDALVMQIHDQVRTGQFKVTDKKGNVLNVQCSLPIRDPMCPWTDYGKCPTEVCQHGGICQVAVSCQYFCKCRSGWFGQFCEKGVEPTKPAEPVKKKDNLWLLWLLIVPLVILGLLALLCCFCCGHRCCWWGAAAGPRKVQIIEEDIYQDVPACSEHGTVRSCRSMHSARPSSIYAINPPQMASDAGSTYYHALGRPFAVAFSDNTFSAIGYATNDMGIYNSSGRKMLPAASCCGDDEIEVIMNNPGRRGSCCGSMISETGSGYHSALGNRYAVAYNDRAFNTYSSMPRMGSIRHYN